MILFLLNACIVSYLVWRMVDSTLEWFDTYEAELSVRLTIVFIYFALLIGLASWIILWSSHGL